MPITDGQPSALKLNDGLVESFEEKPVGEGGLINAGFFILSPKILDYIDGDQTIFEQDRPAELRIGREHRGKRHG